MSENRDPLDILVIAPHPDDAELGAGGFLIMAADEVEVAIQSEEASKLALKWDMNPDLDQVVEDNMFQVFEMTAELS